jgi:hypothetical protein
LIDARADVLVGDFRGSCRMNAFEAAAFFF